MVGTVGSRYEDKKKGSFGYKRFLSRNKVSFASYSIYRVSSHTGSPCERTAQVLFPHSYVFVIHEAVQCALLNLKAQDNKALEGKASQDLAQKLGIGSLATERWPGATHAGLTRRRKR